MLGLKKIFLDALATKTIWNSLSPDHSAALCAVCSSVSETSIYRQQPPQATSLSHPARYSKYLTLVYLLIWGRRKRPPSTIPPLPEDTGAWKLWVHQPAPPISCNFSRDGNSSEVIRHFLLNNQRYWSYIHRDHHQREVSYSTWHDDTSFLFPTTYWEVTSSDLLGTDQPCTAGHKCCSSTSNADVSVASKAPLGAGFPQEQEQSYLSTSFANLGTDITVSWFATGKTTWVNTTKCLVVSLT